MSDQPVAMIGPFPKAWWTSNTPHVVSTTGCDYRRWLGQHAGAHGTGWRYVSHAVPLATGTGIHKGVQLVAEWILDWQAAHANQRLLEIPRAVVAWAATEAAERYAARARARGLQLTLTDATTSEMTEALIVEQATLIEAVTWVWAVVHLPALLQEYVLVAVEPEDVVVMDCTCGLGDGISDVGLHDARGCAGIYYQAKCDQLWRKIDRQTLTYVEFKGWGSVNLYKRAKWKTNGQLILNMEAASRRYGVGVDEAFVVALIKGWRGRDRGAPPTEPKYQHTPLIYGYYDEGNPPLRPPQFAAQYTTLDALTGKQHRLPSTFKKLPIWQMPLTASREGATAVETWIVDHCTPKVLAEAIEVLGPFQRNVLQVPRSILAVRAEERRFRADVDYLREQGAVMPDHPLVDQVIARSWECLSYDGIPCEGTRVCFYEPGWENPEAMGGFERRRPHHEPEAAAVAALGHELPAHEDDEDGGRDDGAD